MTKSQFERTLSVNLNNRRGDPPTVAVVRQYATPAKLARGGSLRRLGERSEPYKPPLSNKGGAQKTKDNGQKQAENAIFTGQNRIFKGVR